MEVIGAVNQLKIRQVRVDRLKPWEGNPRKNDQAVSAVARSIGRFGFNVPILCDKEFTIIAGHTRWKAAQELGLAKLPAVVLPLAASDHAAFAIADNRTSQIAEWDYKELGRILSELRDTEAGLEGLAFSDDELAAILTPETEVNWDDLEEYLQATSEKAFVLYPIKIRLADRGVVRERLGRLAEQHEIRHRDPAVTAGDTLCLLLGIER